MNQSIESNRIESNESIIVTLYAMAHDSSRSVFYTVYLRYGDLCSCEIFIPSNNEREHCILVESGVFTVEIKIEVHSQNCFSFF